MYVPSHFNETRTEVLHKLIREYPQAALVTLGSGGLTANHIPFEFDPDPAPFGTLRGHVARANPVWQDFSKDVEVLVVFQGPQAYISPSWYETKKQTGKVVPTYNYIVVHAHGALRVVQDKAWLRDLVERLTNRFEGQRAEPWRVTDAPDEFVDKLLGAIVGLEIPVSRLIGKWKLSQNRPQEDREGVVKGLRESADAEQLAMVRLMDEIVPRT